MDAAPEDGDAHFRCDPSHGIPGILSCTPTPDRAECSDENPLGLPGAALACVAGTRLQEFPDYSADDLGAPVPFPRSRDSASSALSAITGSRGGVGGQITLGDFKNLRLPRGQTDVDFACHAGGTPFAASVMCINTPPHHPSIGRFSRGVLTLTPNPRIGAPGELQNTQSRLSHDPQALRILSPETTQEAFPSLAGQQLVVHPHVDLWSLVCQELPIVTLLVGAGTQPIVLRQLALGGDYSCLAIPAQEDHTCAVHLQAKTRVTQIATRALGLGCAFRQEVVRRPIGANEGAITGVACNHTVHFAAFHIAGRPIGVYLDPGHFLPILLPICAGTGPVEMSFPAVIRSTCILLGDVTQADAILVHNRAGHVATAWLELGRLAVIRVSYTLIGLSTPETVRLITGRVPSARLLHDGVWVPHWLSPDDAL